MRQPAAVSLIPRYDFHIHSRRSYDCVMRPRGIVRAARGRGLSGIAVTDHGTIGGGADVREIAPADLLVIVGAEIYTAAGDIVCLFLTDEIRGHDPLDVIAQTHAQGGVAFLPHPLRSHPRPIPAGVLEACDAFEALNSRAGWFAPQLHAPDGVNWAPLVTKPGLGSSDAHFYSEIGRAYTSIPGPVTEQNLRSALVHGPTTPGGHQGPSRNFYLSQLVRMVKTRDPHMALRFTQRVWRRLRHT